MTDQPTEQESPPKQTSAPQPAPFRPYRRAALWSLMGGVCGAASGAMLGFMFGSRLGMGNPNAVASLAVDRALIIGVAGAIFVGGVALIDGLIQSRRKPPV